MRAGRAYGNLRRLWRDRGGAAALEFALVMPPFCLILVGMFELAMVTFTQAAMEGGLREAARTGMVGPPGATEAERTATILAIIDEHTLGLVDLAEATVTFQVYDGFNNVDDEEPYIDANGNGQWDSGETYDDLNGNLTWDEDVGEGGLGGATEVVQYTVEYDYAMITPFIAPIMGGADGKVHLAASVVLRNEPWELKES